MTATTLSPTASPDTIIPLTGRRLEARLAVWAPLGLAAVGAVTLATSSLDGLGRGLLSAGVPGLGQLAAGRVLPGVLFALLWLVLLGYAMLRSGGWSLLFLLPVAAIDAAGQRPLIALGTGLVVGAVTAVAIGVSTESRRRRRMAVVQAERAAAPVVVGPRRHLADVHPADPPELSSHLAAYHRYFMRFGMTDPQDWSVFDDPKHMDQELRYQLALSAWAVYHHQQQLTPAFRQHAGQVLGNLAERGRAPRVWDYTRSMNLKALRWEGDPFKTENVMYSGYIANILSMHAAMTGADTYMTPGSYTLHDGDQRYEWSLPAIIDRLVLQHQISPLGSISCFPGSVWPPCQMFSLRAIQLFDATSGSDHEATIDRVIEAIVTYFVGDDGHIDTCRYTNGVRHPIDPLIVGITGQAGTAAWLHTWDPATAERIYERAIRPRMTLEEDGRVTLRLGRMDTYDTSYGWNPGMPYSMALALATEVGDIEMAVGLQMTLEEMLTPDAERPGPGSIASLALTFIGLANSRRAMAAGHRRAPSRQGGPELASAPHPQVLVTSATTDGRGVHATLEPGPHPSAELALSFSGLAPDRDHVVRIGAQQRQQRSDRAGALAVDVDATAPLMIAVNPADRATDELGEAVR